MNFAKGFNSVTGEIEGTCVKADIAQATIGAPSTSYRIDIASSSQELSEHLGVSAEASIGFGAFSASTKASYTRDQKTNQYALYIIARADIAGPAVNLVNARIMTAAEDPAGQDIRQAYLTDYLGFFNKCGDQYLDSAITGATYRGVIRVETSSESEKTAVLREIKAKYGAASASANITEAVTALSSRYNISVTEFYDGVLPESFAQDAPTLIANATRFPALFEKQCTGQTVSASQLNCLKSAVFQDYRKLILGDPDTSAVTKARANFNLTAEFGLKYQTALSDALFAQANPHLFSDTPAELAGMVSTARDLLSRARVGLTECNDNLRRCLAPAESTPPLPDPATLQRPHWIDIGKATSCADYQQKFRASRTAQPGYTLPDGNYLLYVGNQTAQAARIWCRDMATPTPTEYVSLVAENFSANSETFSQPNLTTTLWKKIRIDPKTLMISSDDFHYTELRGGNPYGKMAFGLAVNSTSSKTPVDARIDLRGTDFRLGTAGSLLSDPNDCKCGYVNFLDTQQVALRAPTNGFAGLNYKNGASTSVSLALIPPS